MKVDQHVRNHNVWPPISDLLLPRKFRPRNLYLKTWCRNFEVLLIEICCLIYWIRKRSSTFVQTIGTTFGSFCDEYARVVSRRRMMNITCYVWHDSYELERSNMLKHFDVWHDSFMCVTWLTHMCDMTHSEAIPVIRVMLQCVAVCCSVLQCGAVWCSVLLRVIRVMSHIRMIPVTQMSYVTHVGESCHTYEWVVSHIQIIQRLGASAINICNTTHV